jgi:hypothetical protein
MGIQRYWISHSHTVGGNIKWHVYSGKPTQFFSKLKTYLYLVIVFLLFYSRSLKIYTYTKTYTGMLTAVSFQIAPN